MIEFATLSKKKKILLVLSIVILSVFLLLKYTRNYTQNIEISPYPEGKKFAFTITADPDKSTIEETKIIYEFLSAIGLHTTIAVWTQDAKRPTGTESGSFDSIKYGVSCEDEEYLKYMKELQRRGFEIALHTVSAGNDLREETKLGYRLFKEYFHRNPNINIMHSTNLENIYWGKKVVNNALIRKLISLGSKRAKLQFQGEDPKSKYFWGDILNEKTKYVRLWGTKDINTLKMNPSMPFHDPQKPYVNYWFSFSDGWTVDIFNEMIKQNYVDNLVKEKGACIVYTHFARDFVIEGKLNSIFKERMKKIAEREDGWFVTASTLLDRLLLMKKVKLQPIDFGFSITNFNNISVKKVTVALPYSRNLNDSKGKIHLPNADSEIIIDNILPGETKTFLYSDVKHIEQKKFPTISERINMFIQRVFVYLQHN